MELVPPVSLPFHHSRLSYRISFVVTLEQRSMRYHDLTEQATAEESCTPLVADC